MTKSENGSQQEKQEKTNKQKKNKPIHKHQRIKQVQQLTKTLLARLYREFSRQKYNKYRHQFPRMRESQLVSLIIHQWQRLQMSQKKDLYNTYVVQKHLINLQSSESDGQCQPKEKEICQNGIRTFMQFDEEKTKQHIPSIKILLAKKMENHIGTITNKYAKLNTIDKYFRQIFQAKFSIQESQLDNRQLLKYNQIKKKIIQEVMAMHFQCIQLQKPLSQTRPFFKEQGCHEADNEVSYEVEEKSSGQIGVRSLYYKGRREQAKQFPVFRDIIDQINLHDQQLLGKHGVYQQLNSKQLFCNPSQWVISFINCKRYFNVESYQSKKGGGKMTCMSWKCYKCEKKMEQRDSQAHFNKCYQRIKHLHEILRSFSENKCAYVHFISDSPHQNEWLTSTIIYAGSVSNTDLRKRKLFIDSQLNQLKKGYFMTIRISQCAVIHLGIKIKAGTDKKDVKYVLQQKVEKVEKVIKQRTQKQIFQEVRSKASLKNIYRKDQFNQYVGMLQDGQFYRVVGFNKNLWMKLPLIAPFQLLTIGSYLYCSIQRCTGSDISYLEKLDVLLVWLRYGKILKKYTRQQRKLIESQPQGQKKEILIENTVKIDPPTILKVSNWNRYFGEVIQSTNSQFEMKYRQRVFQDESTKIYDMFENEQQILEFNIDGNLVDHENPSQIEKYIHKRYKKRNQSGLRIRVQTQLEICQHNLKKIALVLVQQYQTELHTKKGFFKFQNERMTELNPDQFKHEMSVGEQFFGDDVL